MVGERVEEDGDAAGRDRPEDSVGEYAAVDWGGGLGGVPVSPAVGDVGGEEAAFHIAQATRLLSEKSTRQGGRTVIVVPIDVRTLDAARVAVGDDLEKEMALWVARSVARYKTKELRRQGLIDARGAVKS